MTASEMIKLTAEIGRVMMKYGISEEQMQEIIKVHNNNVKAALKTIESITKVFNK